jgi:hypothetical protein
MSGRTLGERVDELVAALDAVDAVDPEVAHGDADRLLLEFVPPRVEAAYERLVERCRWWATA